VAGTAITASGSLRLLEVGRDRAGIAAAGRRLAEAATDVGPAATATATATASAPAAAATGERRLPDQRGRISAHATENRPHKMRTDEQYDIDVMSREISMIPDVVSDVLDDASGLITALAKRLAARGIQHLWLTGCGDSAFAGQAAQLAFQRHSGLAAHPEHALDLARYRMRALPGGSAVIALSFSGQVGRTIEAAIQARQAGHHVVAMTNATAGPLALASSEVLPVEVPTLGFSPGTSTYVAMLGTLLRLAAALAQLRGDPGELMSGLARLPEQVKATLEAAAEPCALAAQALLAARWVAFLGAGPNEATARFGAAKLLEGPQRLGVATNLEEWAHEEYFVTGAGDPVVLVNPSGAGHDRGEEILSELRFMAARPVVISDRPQPAGATDGELLLPLAAGVAEELSPVTACLPAALTGFHLARLAGKQSYNFPGEAARAEHYETIHRVTIGEPA
jgi:glucosamine--fructose-6-phosphate aminotransferase (isomerizing)